jgi:hypothetical protein
MTPVCGTGYLPEDLGGFEAGQGISSTCPIGDVEAACSEMGGYAYDGGVICFAHPEKPFTVVGPVTWNRTVYPDETQQACTAAGGRFIAGVTSGVNSWQYETGSWCFIPGQKTVVGPVCYGEKCYTSELQTACESLLGGTNFADRYCVVDSDYTVVGPICLPDITNADTCYPEETTSWCNAVGGTNIGDIFCVVKGDYSVLGPLCGLEPEMNTNAAANTSLLDTTTTYGYFPTCYQDQAFAVACDELGGTALANGTFCILEGSDYHVATASYNGAYVIGSRSSAEGPSSCVKMGGKDFGSYSCVLQGDYTITTPIAWDRTEFIVSNQRVNPAVQLGFPKIAILEGTYSLYGPNCYGSSCYIGEACAEASGKRLGNFCAIGTISGAPSPRRILLSMTLAGVAAFLVSL